MLNALAYASAKKSTLASIHRLRLGLQGSLILFATLAFVSQRQDNPRCLPSPSVFQLISTYFTTTPAVPAPRIILYPNSILTHAGVKPQSFNKNLKGSLHTLYAQ